MVFSRSGTIFLLKEQIFMEKQVGQILVAEEVAELLTVDKQRIYELVRTKSIPVIRLGERQYRFSRTAIENFLSGGGTQKDEREIEIPE
jgi:excisionase family DNA binding protein